jgi:hypothetical protein
MTQPERHRWSGTVEALMKGSLHTDELLAEVVRPANCAVVALYASRKYVPGSFQHGRNRRNP